jgi:hypothetical protein
MPLVTLTVLISSAAGLAQWQDSRRIHDVILAAANKKGSQGCL